MLLSTVLFRENKDTYLQSKTFFFSDVNDCWAFPGEKTYQTYVQSQLCSAEAAFQRGAGELQMSL